MKYVSILFTLLLQTSLVNAAGVYPTVADYVDAITNRNIENYECAISADYPTYRGCALPGSVDRGKKPGISRVFGILISKTDNVGLIFVLVPNGKEGFEVEVQSQPFDLSDLSTPGMFVVESLEADADDRFHIQFTEGSAGTPQTETFRFKRIGSEWRVSGVDYTSLTECEDGAIEDGEAYSVNLLTGTAFIDKPTDCGKPAMRTTRRVTFPAFRLLEFKPNDGYWNCVRDSWPCDKKGKR